MPTIPLTNRIHTTTAQVPTANLGSALANSDRASYSVQDLADTITLGAYLPLAGGTMTGDLKLNDEVVAKFGAGDDLKIYHDGAHSYIEDSGTGDLRIWADSPNISTASGNKIFYGNNGAAELYFTGAVKKFQTTATGILVTGQIDLAALNTAPSSATDTGTVGEIRVTADYIYVCSDPSTWVRAALATW
tara:strand:+ start:603 stop:1172 length:570 start_codon:yes stop_codon:yes gene_type:complete